MNDVNDYLTQEYGANYMIPDRSFPSHNYPFYKSGEKGAIELFDGEMTIPEVLKIKSCRLFPKENRFINIANNCVYHIICILTKIRRKMQYAIEIMRMHWTDS